MMDIVSEERRLLVRHVCQTIKNANGSVILPVGCASLDEDLDWLLDAIDVPKLLDHVSKGETLDLISLCAQGREAVRRKTLQSDYTYAHQFKSNLSYHGIRDGEISILEHEHGHNSLELLLDFLPASMKFAVVNRQSIQEAAYMIFLGSAKGIASSDLIQTLQTQLEIAPDRARELEAVVSIGFNGDITYLSRIDAYVKLLATIKPGNFQHFNSFLSWRQTLSSLIESSARYAAEHLWKQKNSSNVVSEFNSNSAIAHDHENGNKPRSATARRMLARIAGHLRRLNYRNSDEFDPEEDLDAINSVSESIKILSSHCDRESIELSPGISVQLAEQLLHGMFDPLEEGHPSGEYEELLSILQGHVWPQLSISPGIHAALLAWVNFWEFQSSREIGPLHDSADSLRRLQSHKEDEKERHFIGAILESLSQISKRNLSDRHANMKNLQELQGMVVILECAETALGRRSSLGKCLEDCLKSSVSARFLKNSMKILSEDTAVDSDKLSSGRREKEFRPATEKGVSDGSIVSIAKLSEEILNEECLDFAPMLLSRLPTARATIALEIHRNFGSIFLPWLISLQDIAPPSLDAIRSAQGIEGRIEEEVTHAGLSMDTWSISARLEPLIYSWSQKQLKLLQEWAKRIQNDDDWSSAARGRTGASKSSVDIIKLISDAIDALFGLGVEVPAGAVLCLVDGSDLILGEFAKNVVWKLGSADDAIPLPPPMTRFKKDLAQQAEVADMYATSQHLNSSANTPESSKSKLKIFGNNVMHAAPRASASNTNSDSGKGLPGIPPVTGSAAWLQALTSDQTNKLFQTSYESLAVRANSMKYLSENMITMKRTVVKCWCEMYHSNRIRSQQPVDGLSAMASEDKPDWAIGIFGGAIESAEKSIEEILRFAAIKMICGDLRTPIFERLYLHNASSFTLGPILVEVDTRLGNLCAGLREDMASNAATHVCAMLSASIVHVLLDGGPWRLFTISDVELLNNDLMLLRETFHASGAGLSMDTVLRLTSPIEQILSAMTLETPYLIDSLSKSIKQPLGQNIEIIAIGAEGQATNNSKGGSNPQVNPDVALKILCHRADHAASKILKKDYKIPKKLSIGNLNKSNSITRSVNTAFGMAGSGGSGKQSSTFKASPSLMGRRRILT